MLHLWKLIYRISLRWVNKETIIFKYKKSLYLKKEIMIILNIQTVLLIHMKKQKGYNLLIGVDMTAIMKWMLQNYPSNLIVL